MGLDIPNVTLVAKVNAARRRVAKARTKLHIALDTAEVNKRFVPVAQAMGGRAITRGEVSAPKLPSESQGFQTTKNSYIDPLLAQRSHLASSKPAGRLRRLLTQDQLDF